MPPVRSAVIALPVCAIELIEADGRLHGLNFLPPDHPLQAPQSPLAAEAARQLALWLDDPAHRFDLPLAELGTPFQRRVWALIAAIPCGQTRRYGELAIELGSAARAVGQACGANPFPLLVPCHRVLSAQGQGGFAHAREGWLLDLKRWLLEREATQ